MLKLYLDNCCYNRPFDDLTNQKNYIESQAIIVILDLYKKDKLDIYKSKILDYEISQMKNITKKNKILDVYSSIQSNYIDTTNEIIDRAKELKKYNIKEKDALHIAYAEYGNLDYFITVDKILINATSKVKDLKIKVMNPIEFIMEVM